MDRFSLDDVGDSFRIDIQAVLDGLRPRLAVLSEPAAAETERLRLAAVEDLLDGCQTITGSGATLEAHGLVSGGQALSRLAEATREALEAFAAARARLHLLAQETENALPVLEQLLAMELARDAAGAQRLASGLEQRVEDVIAGRPVSVLVAESGAESAAESTAESTTNAESEDGFSFDEPADSTPIQTTPESSRRSTGTDTFTGVNAEIREAFAQEAIELLDLMDQQAAALERGAVMEPIIRELFRAYHTFKGSANTVGLSTLGAAAHAAEDELEGWAPSRIDARPAATALMRVQTALRAGLEPGATIPEPAWITAELQRAHHVADRTAAPVSEPVPVLAPVMAAPQPAPGETSEESPGQQRRYLRVAAKHLDGLMHLAGELVSTRSRLSARVGILADAQRELATSRHRLVTTVDGFRARNEFIGLDGRRPAGPPRRDSTTVGASGPGRRASRFDALFTDLELDRYEDIHVLARSMNEITGDIGELQGQIQRAIADIGEDAEALGRSVTGIQGEITRARMVPLDQLFARLHLAVQDAAGRSGKQVRVTFAGGTVALDKTIVDGMATPLLHLVRNAVAHGIESRDQRTTAGKPEEGLIALTARQEGGQIIVQITDDGQGLDLARLHRRGLELGLIDATTPVDSEAVRQLIFISGLSTASQVDEVSGRGVGCDVARQEIQRLNGTLGVQSTSGRGTTFLITLPLTLAISRALMIQVADRLFAVPMNFVERILDLDLAEISTAGGIRRINHAGVQIRLVPPTTLLTGLPDPERLPGAALLIRLGERRWAIPVDGLLHQEDIVVNSLGELLSGHPLFAGVTLSGTGKLVPIIDIPGLLAAHGVAAAPVPGLVAANRATTLPLPPTGTPPRAHEPLRVLFVDDSLSVRKVAEQQLTALGITVILATDGEDALAKLRANPVDLVFTDLEMPRMHGYDLLREIRYIPAFQSLPVIVVSSRVGDKHRTLAEQLGANEYLSKPFAPEQLRRIIDQWARRP